MCLWPVRSFERVASAQFGEQGEVTVPSEQRFDAVSDAYRCDACVVHGTADDMGRSTDRPRIAEKLLVSPISRFDGD